MTKIQLINDRHGQKIVVHAQFDIGRVHEHDPGKQMVIAVVGVTPMKQTLKHLLQKYVPKDRIGDWETTLQEYVNLAILERIGVASHPIVRKNGRLEGFRDGYEILGDRSS
jgi:hypothetical protein